ncbi:hypothetical protein NDU88_003444 [Pleurodeles waltl]|uniref:Uncharacterized protein n=1 Tax=Pleurodeles waltl TaxID=8319 RepID=A0AAV7Q8Y5_PLEWA|nr:hypothetical protein NDU88_003444 [Pleurodeles waltl]
MTTHHRQQPVPHPSRNSHIETDVEQLSSFITESEDVAEQLMLIPLETEDIATAIATEVTYEERKTVEEKEVKQKKERGGFRELEEESMEAGASPP